MDGKISKLNIIKNTYFDYISRTPTGKELLSQINKDNLTIKISNLPSNISSENNTIYVPENLLDMKKRGLFFAEATQALIKNSLGYDSKIQYSPSDELYKANLIEAKAVCFSLQIGKELSELGIDEAMNEFNKEEAKKSEYKYKNTASTFFGTENSYQSAFKAYFEKDRAQTDTDKTTLNKIIKQARKSIEDLQPQSKIVDTNKAKEELPVIDKMKSLELEDVDAYTKWQGVSVLDYGSMITNKDKLYGCATSLDKELADANIYISKATSYYRIAKSNNIQSIIAEKAKTK